MALIETDRVIRQMGKPLAIVTAVNLSLLLAATFSSSARAAEAPKPEPTGQELAFDNRKGNCLACHAMPGEPKAVTNTNIAPPLIGMAARFPDRRKLYGQIWDATRANPDTAMPPFGKNGILTDTEINKVVDYVYGL
jgi:sulfur-oxidizing protein SoxX